MQRIPVTVEEQLILKAIKEECPWENLSKRLQATLTSKEEWHRRIVEHCIKKRQQWNTSFARKVCREGEYYEDMMRYLRKNLALFPYHLAEYVCRVMRVSPFRYYCDMIFEVMKNEKPYDSIPNFSAADALRLTGIGRNEFIDIMNKCRSKKIMWKLNKSIAKELLPTQPVDFAIEPWWGVCLVNFTLEEFKVRLIYFDVPVYPDDHFKVSRLEGFVSNRDQSYEDPIEELLYAVFVVSSENATVAELATTLQADLSQLQAAASFACRLGWAVKLIDPGSILQDTSIPGSPKIALSDEEDAAYASISSNVFNDGDVAQQEDISGIENYGLHSGHARVAFIVDANITSYLMMGSVSPAGVEVDLGLAASGDVKEHGVLPWVEALEAVEREPLEAGTSAREEVGAREVTSATGRLARKVSKVALMFFRDIVKFLEGLILKAKVRRKRQNHQQMNASFPVVLKTRHEHALLDIILPRDRGQSEKVDLIQHGQPRKVVITWGDIPPRKVHIPRYPRAFLQLHHFKILDPTLNGVLILREDRQPSSGSKIVKPLANPDQTKKCGK
ncbi:hypothetical protein MANES_18G025208v8 [Manihot esculenta]|uniref:Uncharacterized protein n=1 Tax=Manihot esculenta TaxID=3983 RepID=A0ACB7FYJ2_MANES|nr:hypothetical protein MANES_18G025208v8 [Manihot esculenta]